MVFGVGALLLVGYAVMSTLSFVGGGGGGGVGGGVPLGAAVPTRRSGVAYVPPGAVRPAGRGGDWRADEPPVAALAAPRAGAACDCEPLVDAAVRDALAVVKAARAAAGRDDRRGGQEEDRAPPPRPPPPPPPPAEPAPPPPRASLGKDLIIGLATKVPFEFLYRFVRSGRAVMPGAAIVLVTDQLGEEYRELYAAFGVTAHEISVPDLPASYRSFHPSSFRWVLIADWMEAQPSGEYARVFFTDVRDTVFQRNIFDEIPDGATEGFVAFLEHRPLTIAECGWNSKWISDCFGGDMLARVGGNIISCSGTSLATWESGLLYAGGMRDEVMKRASCERNGVDQGIHNVFVWTNRVPGTRIVPLETGPVASVQSMPFVRRDRFGRVVNDNGDIMAIVHQWDRSEALKQQYASEYFLVHPNERNRK